MLVYDTFTSINGNWTPKVILGNTVPHTVYRNWGWYVSTVFSLCLWQAAYYYSSGNCKFYHRI